MLCSVQHLFAFGYSQNQLVLKRFETFESPSVLIRRMGCMYWLCNILLLSTKDALLHGTGFVSKKNRRAHLHHRLMMYLQQRRLWLQRVLGHHSSSQPKRSKIVALNITRQLKLGYLRQLILSQKENAFKNSLVLLMEEMFGNLKKIWYSALFYKHGI